MSRKRILPRTIIHQYVDLHMSIALIGKEYGCNPDIVSRNLKEMGVKLRTGRTKRDLTPEFVAELINDYVVNKMRVVDIAEKHHMSRPTLQRIFYDHKVPMRNKVFYNGRPKSTAKSAYRSQYSESQQKRIRRTALRVKNIAERHLLDTDGGKQIYGMLKTPYQDARDLDKHLERCKAIAERCPQEVTGWKAITMILKGESE